MIKKDYRKLAATIKDGKDGLEISSIRHFVSDKTSYKRNRERMYRNITDSSLIRLDRLFDRRSGRDGIYFNHMLWNNRIVIEAIAFDRI